MRDDCKWLMQTDKHILPGREPDTSELLMAQDRELGTKQWKQVIYTIAKGYKHSTQWVAIVLMHSSKVGFAFVKNHDVGVFRSTS